MEYGYQTEYNLLHYPLRTLHKVGVCYTSCKYLLLHFSKVWKSIYMTLKLVSNKKAAIFHVLTFACDHEMCIYHYSQSCLST